MIQKNTANPIEKREAGNNKKSPWQMQDSTSGKWLFKMQIVVSSLVGWLSATPEIVDGSLCVWVSSDKADQKVHVKLLLKGFLLTEKLEWHPGWEHSTFCFTAIEEYKGGWDGFPPLQYRGISFCEHRVLMSYILQVRSASLCLQPCKFSCLGGKLLSPISFKDLLSFSCL